MTFLDIPRGGSRVRASTIIIFVFLIIGLYSFANDILDDYPGQCSKPAAAPRHPEPMGPAGNRTLGFSSIYFINLAHRYDRLDAASLQAYLSGVDLVELSAVEPNQIKDVGMPPTHRQGLKIGEKGCWRAHANVSCIKSYSHSLTLHNLTCL